MTRSERSYFIWQAVIEIIASIVTWINTALLWAGITDVKVWVLAESIIGTVAIAWWMLWEYSRLPKETKQ